MKKLAMCGADAGGRAEDFFLHEDGNSGWNIGRALTLFGGKAGEGGDGGKSRFPEAGRRLVRACAAALLSAAMLLGAPEETAALREPTAVEQAFSGSDAVMSIPPGKTFPPQFHKQTGAVFFGTKAGPLSQGFRMAIERSRTEGGRHPRGRMRREGIRQACLGLSGERLLKKVNAEWNAAGRWRSDMEVWGELNRWATPEEFIERGGDCEDFAFAKWATLRDLGWPSDRLWIACIDPEKVPGRMLSDAHAVLMAQTEDGEIMALDIANGLNKGKTVYSLDRFASMYGYPAMLMTERRQWTGIKKDSQKSRQLAGGGRNARRERGSVRPS